MKKIHKIFAVFIACMLSLSLCACGGFGDDNPPAPEMYTIQYTDGAGIHSIGVESGKLYSIKSIPQKNGYEFLGLYDAEVGGTQYINSSGSSVAVFTDKQDMVLYPQFKAKEYTLVLDYQGAAVTGSRSLSVSYNSLINDLPMNLSKEHENFVGWYTQPDKNGIQVADQYGIIPSKNIVDESIFNFSDPKGYIYLYAGFQNEEFTVTFYVTENSEPQEVKAEYGTPLSQIAPETKVDGKAVLTWSKKRNDINQEQLFNGNITSDMVLYAAELAPIIDFDSNGGKDIESLMARAGDLIELPVPTKTNYKFIGWQDISGNAFTSTVMPTESIKLIATWHAMIVFDTNGGTKVENISEPQDTQITLPETEKSGYVFVGWYTADKVQYTSTTMPSEGVALKAGWYKIKSEKIVKVASSGAAYVQTIKASVDSTDGLSSTSVDEKYLSGLFFDFANKFGINNTQIKIEWHFRIKKIDKSDALLNDKFHIEFYTEKVISSSNLLESKVLDISNSAYRDYEFTTTMFIENSLYVCWYCNESPSGYANNSAIKDLYYTISYPDTANLYL